MLTIISRPMC